MGQTSPYAIVAHAFSHPTPPFGRGKSGPYSYLNHEEDPKSERPALLIPTCILSVHSKMRKKHHRTKSLLVIAELMKASTKDINEFIER